MATMSVIRMLQLTLFLGLSAQADRPKPGEVRLNKISYAGSGCPLGSVVDIISDDENTFTLLFDQYTVEAGPNVEVKRAKKECRIIADLRIPPGWSYTVAQVDFRGFANIEKGAVGEQRSNLYFKDRGPVLKSEFTGPFVNDYMVRNSVGKEDHPWQNCKKPLPLTIDTAIIVRSGGKSRALLTVDSTDGRLKQHYRLRFRRCGKQEE